MRRRWVVVAGIVVVIAAVIATLNDVVDPRDEFYSGDALTAALASHCLLGDDVVRGRSYPEFKRDLFRRRHKTTVVVGANSPRANAVNLSYPGFGPAALLDTMRFLARGTPDAERLSVRVATDPSWFNTATHFDSASTSLGARIGYLLSPFTFASTLDLMRR